MDGSRQQQQQQQIQQILQQALASSSMIPTTHSQHGPVNSLSHVKLTPSSSNSPDVCTSPLPLQFPSPSSSSSHTPLSPPVGHIIYTQPANLAGSGGFALISPSGARFAALQVIGAGHQLTRTGVVVLPSSVASNYLPNQLGGTTVSNTPILQPFVIRHGGVAGVNESVSRIAMHTSPVGQISPRALGIATVHHLGTGDAKESPFVHLRGHLQSVKSHETPMKAPSASGVCRRPSGESSESEKPQLKRIKLEVQEEDVSAKFYRKQYVESHERDLAEIRASYQDHMTELFFLENGGNLMDYMLWSKRPNVHLNRLLQAESLDAVGVCGSGEEVKQINNEVKVLTTFGSTVPIVTPVAIATTLPAAITALQQQELASGVRKAGGRHGMVFGYVSPKSSQLPPLVPGGMPLSPKAVTTTVGSPPSYLLVCSAAAPMSVGETSSQLMFDTQSDEQAGILDGPTLVESNGISGTADSYVCTVPATISSSVSAASSLLVSSTVVQTILSRDLVTSNELGGSSSHDAIVDLAKQEALVLQRVAELRRQGMWSSRRLPKVQEPTRCKSHWDYVLSEMQWLAVDFAQERRWKIVAAKKIAHDVVKYHIVLEERQREKAMKTAGIVARMVRDFWARMKDIVYCSRHVKVEEKRNRLLEFITQGMISNLSSQDVDVNGIDHCYSTVGEMADQSDDEQDEIKDLLREGELPLEELIDKYAGAYEVDFVIPSSPESLMSSESNSSDDCDSIVEFRITPSSQGNDNCSEALTKIPKDIRELCLAAQEARPVGNTLNDCQVIIVQPHLMKLPLREYQLIGVEWMTKVFRPGFGCILADAPGLGKKVQSIGFLANVAANNGLWGPHLVVVPTCYLLAWETELERCFPACQSYIYYGDVGRRKKLRKECYGSSIEHRVFVTSYNILQEDLEHFHHVEWQCLILDDVDAVMESDVFSSLLSLSSQYNILISGIDIVSQVSLASIGQLLTTKEYRTEMTLQMECTSSSDLQQLIQSLWLRRTEDDVREQLPKISESDVLCSLSCRQRDMYKELVVKHTGASAKHRVADVFELLVSLQKLINYPDLLHPRSVHYSFCMDPLEYRTSACVRHAVVHDMWKRADVLAEKNLLLDEIAAAENSMQDTETDLCVELELIMSASKHAEPIVETSPEVRAERMSAVLRHENLFNAVFPHDICLKLEQPSFRTNGEKQSVFSMRGKSWNFNLCRSAVVDVAYGSVSPMAILTNKLYRIEEDYVRSLRSCLKWLLSVIPAVSARCVNIATLHTSDDDADDESILKRLNKALSSDLGGPRNSGGGLVVFPDSPTPSSSGKLMELDRLLSLLFGLSRRVVVMTRMTQMLDVLEAFINTRQHHYLRLDPSIPMDQRREIVQRFNADKHIQCLLMLSRMPVIGLDLPHVDTVIFYDTDIRLDARDHADKFCRQIANVRDLEVFRLKTSGTIEEVMPFWHISPRLREIFMNESHCEKTSLTQSAMKELFKNTIYSDELVQLVPEPSGNCDSNGPQGNVLLMALDEIEDKDDVIAAEQVNTERKLLTQGVTNSDFEHQRNRNRKRHRSTSCQFEVESYAIDYVERQMEPPFDIDEMAQELECRRDVDMWIAAADKTDENQGFKAGKVAEEVEDENPLTYNYDPEQLFVDDTSGELMPVWAPPTPPQDDSDIYIDQTQSFVYEPVTMSESQLPPVYVRKGHKRHRVDQTARKQKIRARDDLPSVPRSLFDCPQTIAQRMERDARLLKQQGMLKPGLKIQLQQTQQHVMNTTVNSGASVMIGRPMVEQVAQHETAEWLIYEDWALLQALQTLQEMPLNLLASSPGHLPNWDIIADIVNGVSRTYRSPKQCKQRYENVILPREEGRVTYDASPRKLKKASKGLYKTKYNRSMRTQQLYVQDNSKASTTLYTLRFDSIKLIAAARTPATRPQPTGAVAAGLKNTKHIAVLAESGINYDQPLSPGHVAAMRAERIAKEMKEKKLASAAGNLVQVDVQQTTQPSQTQQQQMMIQRPSVAVPSSTLQQLIIQPTQAAGGHVILQSGQQLISAATGQQVIASVDGRTQQMTIVQGAGAAPGGQAAASGTMAAAPLLTAGLVKSSGVTMAAAAGTSVVTAVSLARSLSMAGIIVSQTIAGQTIATINKGQTVVAPASFLQAQCAGQVRGTLRNVAPFALKDASGVSIVSQNANEAAIARVISTTTSLTPAQLVVTQQKPGLVGVSTVPQGSLQQQLLGLSVAPTAGTLAAAAASKGLTTMQPVQVMRQKQVLQQLRPTMSLQQIPHQVNAATGSMSAVVAGGQKTVTVTTPTVGGISPAIQLKSMQGGAAFQEILKRTQQQQQVARSVSAIQQIQVTKAQLLDGMQIQQVASSVSAQTVATLMKAVASTTTGTMVSSVTLPTAPGASSTINFLPQQKLLAASKIQPQQIRQLQMQKRPAATVQIQNPQKMTATLQQMTKIQTSGSPVIFRPQQVVVQQMSTQQFAKSTQGVQQPRIQQFISSVPASASAAAILSTQTGAASTISLTAPATVAKTLSVTITTTNLPSAVATVALSTPAATSTVSNLNAALPLAAAVKLLPTSVTTLVKQIKDPSSALTLTSRTAGGAPAVVGVQQVLIRPGTMPGVITSTPHITLATVSTARTTSVVGATVSAPVATAAATSSVPAASSGTTTVVPVSPGVQQAVQEVVQQAQAQARQQPMSGINFVAVTSGCTIQSPGQTSIGSNQTGSLQQQGSCDGSNKSSSPYVMRLRNQKS